MFRKELGMAMVAYNLTCQLRNQAAIIAKCEPRELSFTGVWAVYRYGLQSKLFKDGAQWQEQFNIGLLRASKHKLPNRAGWSYPREAYPRRPKTTHFQKRKKKEKASESDEKSLKCVPSG